MMTLFNDEYILKTYVANREKEAAQTATQNAKADAARKFYKKGNSVEDIADALEVTVKDVEEWLGLVAM